MLTSSGGCDMNLKNHKTRHSFALAASFSLLLSLAVSAGYAAEEGSLDSMWMDQNNGSKTEETTAPAATSGATHAAVEPESKPASASDSDTIAPMCNLDTFRGSDIVSKGGWPGVGPFKADTDTDFFDDHHNKLHLDLNGQQITRAELALNNRELSGNADKDLLDMQMNIDFFLEAVGIKPGKIEELNAELAKNKEVLLKGNDPTPLNLKAGRCFVSIEKKKSIDGNKLDYLVSVNSLEANKQILKQHSVSESDVPKPRTTVATSTPSDATYTPLKQPVKPVVTTPVATPVATMSDTALKDQFIQVISSWQKVKKVAVHDRQTDQLATVLAGKALVRQTDAIKWLTTNKKFYDMNPKGVVVDQFAELAPAKKYMVSAQVREAYKFIDEPTGKVLKEVDDVNKVNYTIEKIAGKWVITDSALLASPAKSPIIKATTNKSTR